MSIELGSRLQISVSQMLERFSLRVKYRLVGVSVRDWVQINVPFPQYKPFLLMAEHKVTIKITLCVFYGGAQVQPLRKLDNWLRGRQRAGGPPLYRVQDLRNLFSDLDDSNYKALLYRATRAGLLTRVARGLYRDPNSPDDTGRLLFLAAALLRPWHFNYISLETALSDAGWISQIPMNWITVVGTGRTNTIKCETLGTIEFIHTAKDPRQIEDQLFYDPECHMYRATPELAMSEMRAMRRSTVDLVDQRKIKDAVLRDSKPIEDSRTQRISLFKETAGIPRYYLTGASALSLPGPDNGPPALWYSHALSNPETWQIAGFKINDARALLGVNGLWDATGVVANLGVPLQQIWAATHERALFDFLYHCCECAQRSVPNIQASDIDDVVDLGVIRLWIETFAPFMSAAGTERMKDWLGGRQYEPYL